MRAEYRSGNGRNSYPYAVAPVILANDSGVGANPRPPPGYNQPRVSEQLSRSIAHGRGRPPPPHSGGGYGNGVPSSSSVFVASAPISPTRHSGVGIGPMGGGPPSLKNASVVGYRLPEGTDLKYVAAADRDNVCRIIYEILCLDPNAPECTIKVNAPVDGITYGIVFTGYTGWINGKTCNAQLEQNLGTRYAYLADWRFQNTGTMLVNVKMIDPGRVNLAQYAAQVDHQYAMQSAANAENARKRARTGDGDV